MYLIYDFQVCVLYKYWAFEREVLITILLLTKSLFFENSIFEHVQDFKSQIYISYVFLKSWSSWNIDESVSVSVPLLERKREKKTPSVDRRVYLHGKYEAWPSLRMSWVDMSSSESYFTKKKKI